MAAEGKGEAAEQWFQGNRGDLWLKRAGSPKQREKDEIKIIHKLDNPRWHKEDSARPDETSAHSTFPPSKEVSRPNKAAAFATLLAQNRVLLNARL